MRDGCVGVRNQFGCAEMPIIAPARSDAQIQICSGGALKAQNISGAPAINDCIYLPAAAFKFKRMQTARRGEEKASVGVCEL